MKLLSPQEFKHWSDYIPMFNIAENSHLHKSQGLSPHEALTGHKIALPISLALPTPPQNETNDNFKIVFDKILEHIYLNKQESLQFRAQRYTNRERTFKINQLV